MEADDDGLYVVKFRGAGQGPKTLIAELLAGEIGRSLGLPVPDIVFVELDAALSKAEPDPEIQDLLRSSAGLNIGLDFLPGSLAYVPAAQPSIDPGFAAATVWFDAYVMNVDRTPRNPNLLTWHGRPWLIDHGAALYVHHVADDILPRAADRFPQIADHILLPHAAPIGEISSGWRRCCQGRRSSVSFGHCRPTGLPPAEWENRTACGTATWSFSAGGSKADQRSKRRRTVPERVPFEYVLIRVVPRVERGECVNAGVIVICRPRRFLAALVALNRSRVLVSNPAWRSTHSTSWSGSCG